jgi:hypothetical protein
MSFLQALDMVMDGDLLFWSGRYDLFVVWSTDRRHPWDSVTSSETSAAVLEIGSQAGSGKAGSPSKTNTHRTLPSDDALDSRNCFGRGPFVAGSAFPGCLLASSHFLVWTATSAFLLIMTSMSFRSLAGWGDDIICVLYTASHLAGVVDQKCVMPLATAVFAIEILGLVCRPRFF